MQAKIKAPAIVPKHSEKNAQQKNVAGAMSLPAVSPFQLMEEPVAGELSGDNTITAEKVNPINKSHAINNGADHRNSYTIAAASTGISYQRKAAGEAVNAVPSQGKMILSKGINEAEIQSQGLPFQLNKNERAAVQLMQQDITVPFKPVQKKENKTGLPDNLKSGVENLSGFSLDDVKVHYNSGKPAQLNAFAYAQGTDIHIASGQEKHLPHEAWHVVQQKQGRVQPTMQMKGGVNVNDDAGLEQEAVTMGQRALQFYGKDTNNSIAGRDAGFSSHKSNPVQRAIGFEFEIEVPLYKTKDDPINDFFTKKSNTEFAKSHRIYDSGEFHIVQDFSAFGSEGVKTIPEVVVHHSSEDMYKEDFISNVEAAYKYIMSNTHSGVLSLGDDIYAGTTSATLTGSSGGSGQATFGIRPEGVQKVFKSKIEKFGEEFTPLFEAEILSKALSATEQIMKDNIFVNNPEFSKIKGFILLICQYCSSNSIKELQQGSSLDKNKVPFLIRSTMGDIARATLSAESRHFLSVNNDHIKNLILSTTNAIKGSPVISPTKAEPKPVYNVPVELWVEQALNANDQTLKWGSETNNEDSVIIQPEEVGSAMNLPGNKRPYGGVMEERNLLKGPVNVNKWIDFASQVWVMVCNANSQPK